MLIDDASHPEDFAAETPCLRLLQHRGRRPGLSLDSLQLSQPHRVLMLIEGASHSEDFAAETPCLRLLQRRGRRPELSLDSLRLSQPQSLDVV